MRARHKRLATQRGIAAVEMTMVGFMLLVLLFGIIDFGRLITQYQVITNLTREGANLISRGNSMAATVTAMSASAAPLDIEDDGFIVLTEVQADSDGNLSIVARMTFGDSAQASKIGDAVGDVPTLPPTDTTIPQPNRSLYIAEVFYETEGITPLAGMLDLTVGGVLYDVAFF